MSTVTKLPKSSLKKRDAEVTKIEKNLVEITEVPGSSSFRRSYRLKEKPEGIVIRVDEPTQTKATLEAQVNRSRWRKTKLLTKTLTSLEVIRAMKGKQTSGGSTSELPTSALTTTTITSPTTTTTSSSMRTSSSGNMKSPTSNESHRIRGESVLRPSSTQSTASGGSSPTAERRNPKAVNEWRLLKNKLGSMRKNGKGAGLTTTLQFNEGSEHLEPEKVEPRRSSHGDAKTEKAPIKGSILSNSNHSIRRSSKSSQDEGIICKKEDLLFLLSEAAQKEKEGQTVVDHHSSGGTTPEKEGIKPASGLSVVETEKGGSPEKESILIPGDNPRRRRSKSELVEQTAVQIPVPKTPEKSKLKKPDSKTGPPRINVVTFCDNPRTLSSSSYKVKSFENSSFQRSEEGPSGSNSRRNSSEASTAKAEKEGHCEEDNTTRAVKWDESNIVDPALLGDVIEAFLKGMGSSSSTTTTTTTVTEKKVSFKKT